MQKRFANQAPGFRGFRSAANAVRLIDSVNPSRFSPPAFGHDRKLRPHAGMAATVIVITRHQGITISWRWFGRSHELAFWRLQSRWLNGRRGLLVAQQELRGTSAVHGSFLPVCVIDRVRTSATRIIQTQPTTNEGAHRTFSYTMPCCS